MKEIKDFSILFGLGFREPLALVTSHYKGESNVLTVGWAMLAALKPLSMAITIGKTCHSHDIIKNSNEFVIAYPDIAMKDIVNYCGTVSGRDENKISKLAVSPSKYVKAPLLTDCVLNMECKIKGSLDTGSHTLFVGNVLAMYHNKRKKRLYHFGRGRYKPC